jgi:hypothetical protein
MMRNSDPWSLSKLVNSSFAFRCRKNNFCFLKIKKLEGIKMKLIAWVCLAFAMLLSACASASDIDFSKVDAECGKQCQTAEAECNTRFAGYPTLLYTHCKPELRECVKACPPPGTTPPAAPAKANEVVDKTSIAARLRLLEELHKSGDITDKEYADKRQEILKSL